MCVVQPAAESESELCHGQTQPRLGLFSSLPFRAPAKALHYGILKQRGGLATSSVSCWRKRGGGRGK